MFWTPVEPDKLNTWALRLISSGSTAFIGNGLRWGTVEDILFSLLSGLNLIILSSIAFEWR